MVLADHHGKPVSLFNGKDLSGWVSMHGGEWKVEDGVIDQSLGHAFTEHGLEGREA